jgi:hypothetical protein
MKNSYKNYYFFVISLAAIALNFASAASASEAEPIGLDFSLTPVKEKPTKQDAKPNPDVKPLEIPAGAKSAPMGKADDKANTLSELPPPPPRSGEETLPRGAPISVEVAKPDSGSESKTAVASNSLKESIELDFNPFDAADLEAIRPPQRDTPADTASTSQTMTASAPQVEPEAEALSFQPMPSLDRLFQGGTNSLVARAVGTAEGTRTPEGARTRAYRGHTDPGNGRWNLGTFSYQHGARSPEEADQRQLVRLRRQAQTLRQQAESRGLDLTLEEKLNGIDLANQSPRAALSRGGYIDRLKEAHEMGLRGTDAVLWARTRAFLDPNTKRWNAPGLGNRVETITADQQRRLRAIGRAIDAKSQVTSPSFNNPSEQAASSSSPPPDLQAKREEAADRPPEEDVAEQIINFDL